MTEQFCLIRQNTILFCLFPICLASFSCDTDLLLAFFFSSTLRIDPGLNQWMKSREIWTILFKTVWKTVELVCLYKIDVMEKTVFFWVINLMKHLTFLTKSSTEAANFFPLLSVDFDYRLNSLVIRVSISQCYEFDFCCFSFFLEFICFFVCRSIHFDGKRCFGTARNRIKPFSFNPTYPTWMVSNLTISSIKNWAKFG